MRPKNFRRGPGRPRVSDLVWESNEPSYFDAKRDITQAVWDAVAEWFVRSAGSELPDKHVESNDALVHRARVISRIMLLRPHLALSMLRESGGELDSYVSELRRLDEEGIKWRRYGDLAVAAMWIDIGSRDKLGLNDRVFLGMNRRLEDAKAVDSSHETQVLAVHALNIAILFPDREVQSFFGDEERMRLKSRLERLAQLQAWSTFSEIAAALSILIGSKRRWEICDDGWHGGRAALESYRKENDREGFVMHAGNLHVLAAATVKVRPDSRLDLVPPAHSLESTPLPERNLV